MRESGLAREEFYVTTKVIDSIRDIPGAIDGWLARLGVDYVDLYLIHVNSMLDGRQEPTLLAIQREIFDEVVPLSKTATANYLMAEQAKVRQRHDEEIERMNQEYNEALRMNDIFASNGIKEEMVYFIGALDRLMKSRESLDKSWADQKHEEASKQHQEHGS